VTRLHRRLLPQLIATIVSGDISPGARLPPEDALAKRFGVSRGVLREVLQALENRGLIVISQGRGTTVTDPREWHSLDPDVLTALLNAPERTEVLSQASECRRVLETGAAGLAAQRRTVDQLQMIGDTLARMIEHADNHSADPGYENHYDEADFAFHTGVLTASGNPILCRITEPIRRVLSLADAPERRPADRVEQELLDHKRILSAIARGDAEQARLAMDDHLSSEASLSEFRQESNDDGSPELTTQ
jgi:DNA-binding FadR family transcriptional regulator